MRDLSTARVALLGLPRTGKSTYLGAIWQLAQDPQVPDIYEVDFRGDRSYLQRLGDSVARCTELEHTEVDSSEGMQLTLGFQDSRTIRVDIPDLSGELLNQLVEDRHLQTRLSDALDAADRLALFVHPEKVDEPISIAAAKQILLLAQTSAIGAEVESGSALEDERAVGSAASLSAEKPDLPSFSIQKACTAAKYIDALENIANLGRDRWPLKTAVIVSAWDTVDQPDEISPEEWLSSRLPGLASYLEANAEMFHHRIFGVSALGGRCHTPEQREALRARGPVRDRVYGKTSAGIQVPLSMALEWTLFD
jgi:Double-GTPase 1